MTHEHEAEPIPGLPGLPPAGEAILWQGSPDWRALARDAFHVRAVGAYFVVLTLAALAAGSLTGALATAGAGLAGVGLLHLLAWATARATIYTLTNRRIVLRIGVALPKCINLPLATVDAVDAALRPDGTGDLPLGVRGAQKIGYAGLWPHVRPWKLAVPHPMLRAVPQAADVARMIARACLAVHPQARITPLAEPETTAAVPGRAMAA